MKIPKSLKTLIIGKIKDKASQTKVTILNIFNPKIKSSRLSLLRATTHDSHTPPENTHLVAIVSDDHHGTTAAAVEAATARRLKSTGDANVALKCLIVMHHLIKQENHQHRNYDRQWIESEERNFLKLNDFRDCSSFVALELSPWVRWYALYLESLLSSSRVLGFFPNITASSEEKSMEKRTVSSLKTRSILNQTDTLVGLLEQTCQRPESPPLYQNKIVDEIRERIAFDYFSIMRLIMVRLGVLNQRLTDSKMSYDDTAELTRVLRRLENCRESLLGLTRRYRILVQDFWDMVGKVSVKVWDETKSVGMKRITYINGSVWDGRFG